MTVIFTIIKLKIEKYLVSNTQWKNDGIVFEVTDEFILSLDVE